MAAMKKPRKALVMGILTGSLGTCLVLFLLFSFFFDTSMQRAVKKASPSVVNIYTHKTDPVEQQTGHSYYTKRQMKRLRQLQELSLGSGVIFDTHGHIITNLHVIRGASEILVMFEDGRKVTAQLLGKDEETDLAVLKVDPKAVPPARPAQLGHHDRITVGDSVLAIGNPFGFGQSVSAGIISAKGRFGLNRNTYENYIQTDAAINTGSSGGALVNLRGHLIGINTVIFSHSGESNGIGLAIPVPIASKVASDIILYGHVKRGWLGLDVKNIQLSAEQTAMTEQSSAIVIQQVFPHTPAKHFGLMPGDIILSIDGLAIRSSQTGLLKVANLTPGNQVKVNILRNRHIISMILEVGIRPVDRQLNPSNQ